jgi:hypothetical protein
MHSNGKAIGRYISAPERLSTLGNLAISASRRVARSVCRFGSLCLIAMHESRFRHAARELERHWQLLSPGHAATMLPDIRENGGTGKRAKIPR